jgi:chromosome segregation ATPase
MVKATTVQNCVDEEHDNSESESDDDDEPTEDELIDMLEDAKELFNIKRKECKDLTKELITLRKAFDELNASHESLKKDHEELCKDHKKLRKAHSSLCFLTEVRRGNPSLFIFSFIQDLFKFAPMGS